MRVFASKYLGAGIRVGVSRNIRPTGRRRGSPVAEGKVVAAPRAMKPLLIACAVTGGVGLVVFPPLLIATAVCFVLLLVAQARWNTAQKVAAQDRRPPLGTLERAAYDVRAARIGELDAQRPAAQAEGERLADRTAKRLSRRTAP